MSLKKLNEKINEFLKEPLYEMSMAWTSKSNNRCVWVENPTGYNNKYFKYLDGVTFNKAERVARISMLSATYLNHSNSDGLRNWKLNSKEKKELVNLMNQANKKYTGCTNWQATIITYNEDNFGIDFDETINGTFSKEEYPNAFDIDYVMPNYLEL